MRSGLAGTRRCKAVRARQPLEWYIRRRRSAASELVAVSATGIKPSVSGLAGDRRPASEASNRMGIWSGGRSGQKRRRTPNAEARWPCHTPPTTREPGSPPGIRRQSYNSHRTKCSDPGNSPDVRSRDSRESTGCPR